MAVPFDFETYRQGIESVRAPKQRAQTAVPRAARRRPDIVPGSKGSAAVKPEEQDDGFQVGDVLKGAVGGLLSAADYGRAAVTSGVKELTDTVYGSRVGEWMDKAMGRSDEERQADLARMGTGSFNDFRQQLNRRAGSQELLLDQVADLSGGWQRSAAGLALDVGLDPLTYLTLGGSAVAKNVAFKPVSGALRESLYQGSGKAIGKQLATQALESGVSSKAVDRLLVDAARRGAGAITERGLARAGISEAERAALGLSKAPTSKTGKMLQVWEDLKGGIKAPVKTSRPVAAGRKAFTKRAAGEYGLSKIVYDLSAPVAQRANALKAMTTVNTAVRVGREWGNNTMQRLSVDWKDSISKLDDDAAREVTLGAENLVSSELTDNIGGEFARIRQELVDAGVPLGDVTTDTLGYMPHYVSQEWRKLAKTDADAAEYVMLQDVLTKEGSARTRLLTADGNTEFLGRKLQTGSIEEINDIAMDVKGVKIFDDDIRTIMPKYVDQMSNMLGRQKQIDMLTEAGLTVPTATKIVTRQADPETLARLDKEIADAEKVIAKTRGEQLVELSNGEVLRRNQLDLAAEAARGRRAEIQTQVRELRERVLDAGRQVTDARQRLARVESKIGSLQASRDGWAAVVRSERPGVSEEAQRAVAKVEKQIVAARAEAEGLRSQVQKFLRETFVDQPAPGFVRFYRGDYAKGGAIIEGGGRPEWLASQPEIIARNRVQGRWVTEDRALAELYPMNMDPGEQSVLRYVDVPENVAAQIRGLADQPEEIRALSKAVPEEAILPSELMAGLREMPTNVTEFRNSLTERAGMTKGLVQKERNVRNNIGALQTQVDDLSSQIDELSLKKNPPGKGPLAADQRVMEAETRLETATLNRDRLLSEESAAVAAYDLASVTTERQIAVLEKLDEQLQKIISIQQDAAKGGRYATKGGKIKTNRVVDHVTDLQDRVRVVQTILAQQGNDPVVHAIAGLEAAAQAADTAILAKGDELVRLEDLVTSLNDSKFVDEIMPVVSKNMTNMPNGQSIPNWLRDATEVESVRKQLPLIGDFMNKYVNLWKGYAILRPGFHARNAYSAMFNMYLEAGPKVFKNVKKFEKFYEMVRKNPDGYMDDAIRVFGAEDAKMLDDAWGVVSASGSGQTAGEFADGALRAGSNNPLSPDFKLLKVNRRLGEGVENRVRGAHAYDVLNRGGTVDQAVDVVNKWHFNYTDITDFDRAAKLANPFWTFFSRNMALQAQTWYRIPGRLNRSYVNLERNLGYGQEEDTLVPKWFENAGAIRFGGPNAEGDVNYLFPDLPAVQFPGQVEGLTDPTDIRFLSETAPWVKALPELWAGRQSFSGIPFKDQSEAGTGMQVLDRLLPGAQTTMQDGVPMTSDRWQYQLGALVPGFNQAASVAAMANLVAPGNPLPSSSRAQERAPYTALSQLLGIGVRQNTDRSRSGEQFRRNQEAGR
jgi:hypothetical protein